MDRPDVVIGMMLLDGLPHRCRGSLTDIALASRGPFSAEPDIAQQGGTAEEAIG
jgi:hypothetical protein